ncbi:23 kDa integral membrane protein [Ixodes scapularis]
MSAAEKGATGGGDNPPSAPGSTAPSQRVRPSPKYEVKGTSCGVACLKYLLFVVNVIVWLLGLAVVVVAGVTLASGKTSDASLTGVQSVQQAAGTAMFLGCLLLIVGFLGCCGAIKESYLLLAAYFGVLLVILVFEIVAIALAFSFVSSSSMEQSLNDHFVDVISGGRREKEPWKQEEDLNVIYFVQGQLLGLAVVVVAGVTLASGKTSDASLTGVQSVQQAAGTAMFLGCLLLIVGFLGCCGAIKESYLLLAAYFGVLLVILVFEIVAIALAFSFVSSSSMEQSLNDHFVDVISGGRREKEPWKQEEDLNVIYFVQGQLRCCGGKGPEDYAERHLPIPPSCYDNYDTQRTYIYQRGCVAALKEYVRKNGLSIGLVNLFGVFAEIAAMVGACMLMQHFKSAKKAGKNTTQA